MRVCWTAVLAIIVLAGIAMFSLDSIQQSIATAYLSNSTRLDQQERVNWYGREG
jgi:hypothetical protein